MGAVRKIYPSPADFENLSRLRTEPAEGEGANSFDYSEVVVNKPWGYEYLWFQNESVAVWLLYLNPGAATSLHCHVRKRTSLIVLEGQVICSTLEDLLPLKTLGAVVLESCVFHSTRAVSKNGAFVLEVETPPLKGDLVRLKDSFGRAGTGYEGTSQYSREFERYDYKPLGHSQEFRGLSFDLQQLTAEANGSVRFDDCDLLVSFGGQVHSKGRVWIEPGEVVSPKSGRRQHAPVFERLDLLKIRRQ